MTFFIFFLQLEVCRLSEDRPILMFCIHYWLSCCCPSSTLAEMMLLCFCILVLSCKSTTFWAKSSALVEIECANESPVGVIGGNVRLALTYLPYDNSPISRKGWIGVVSILE